MRILGIDNGLQGALVLLEDGVPTQRHVMPVIEIKKGKKVKHEYEIAQIARLLRELSPDHAFLELAHAMKGQGVTSMFGIGLGFGINRGLLTGLNIPHTIVFSKRWQKEAFRGCPPEKGESKAMGVIVCGRLWPSIDFRATERSKKAHEGLVDAALIAYYGHRLLSSPVAPVFDNNEGED